MPRLKVAGDEANFHGAPLFRIRNRLFLDTVRNTLKLQVVAIDRLDGLEKLRLAWEHLDGGVPFRSYDWLTTWWRHYGQPAGHDRLCLHVLAVRDAALGDDAWIGIAPWYAERTRTRGTVLRALGGGEVCSDHLGVVCDSQQARPIATALADHLAQADDWQRLELDAVDSCDPVVSCLAEELRNRDCETRLLPDGNCWAIDLPRTWEEFLALQSKSHRKQLRRAAERVLLTDRAVWQLIESADEFQVAWPVFVDLHQRRRQSLGEPGCFASPAFTNFHREIAQKLLADGRLRLSWLNLDGAPVAAEYHFAGPTSTFAYQGGVDPERLDEEPGRLSQIAAIQHAIAEGHQTFDFLRGDEPYKAHWRAQPHATYKLTALAPSHRSNWLAQTADWADSMASALKAGLRPLVSPAPPTF